MHIYIFRQNLMHTIRFLQWCLEDDRYSKTLKDQYTDAEGNWTDAEAQAKYDQKKSEKFDEICETLETRLK